MKEKPRTKEKENDWKKGEERGDECNKERRGRKKNLKLKQRGGKEMH